MADSSLESESVGGQSLTSIATGAVGCLIVLVTIVGAHVGRSAAQLEAERAELATTRQAAAALEADVNRLAAEASAVRAETAMRRAERERLGTFLAAADQELAARRAALDAESRGRYDTDRDLAEVRAELDRLEKARQATADAPDKTVKIENFPTPLSRPVDNKEIHFQLKQGRLAYVPMNEFVAQFKDIVQEKLWKLKDSTEINETMGPWDGFTIRYTVLREDIPWEEVVRTGQNGSRIGLDKVEFLPASGQLGEPVAEALTNRSAFRGRLDDCNPKHTTVTVWIFPDSFEQFRHVRKELYQLGFTVAGRPLAEWMNIGASGHGSKSAAE